MKAGGATACGINDIGAAIVLMKAGDRRTADGGAIEVLIIGGGTVLLQYQ